MFLVPGKDVNAGSAALYVTTCTGFERLAFEEVREALRARSLDCCELARGVSWAANFGAVVDTDTHGFRAGKGLLTGKALFVVSGFWRDNGSPEPAALEALATLELVENVVLLVSVQDGQSCKPAKDKSLCLPPRADAGLLESLSRRKAGLVSGRENDWQAALEVLRLWRRVSGEERRRTVGDSSIAGQQGQEDEVSRRFRVTATLSGPKRFHTFERNDLARVLSDALSGDGSSSEEGVSSSNSKSASASSHGLGWVPTLDGSHYFEVIARLRFGQLVLGVKLNRERRSLRRLQKGIMTTMSAGKAGASSLSSGKRETVYTSLRSHVAFSLCRAAGLSACSPPPPSSPSSSSHASYSSKKRKLPALLLDPFCGSGAITEAAAMCETAMFCVAGDSSAEAVEKTRRNAIALRKKEKGMKSNGEQERRKLRGCDVVRLDARRLPFRSLSFDLIVTDLPFGNKCKVKDLPGLYAAAVGECHRVLSLSAQGKKEASRAGCTGSFDRDEGRGKDKGHRKRSREEREAEAEIDENKRREKQGESKGESAGGCRDTGTDRDRHDTVSGQCVILTTERVPLERALRSSGRRWKINARISTNVGGLEAKAFVLTKRYHPGLGKIGAGGGGGDGGAGRGTGAKT